MSIGYALSSEEHGPRELVAHARQAEAAGFSFALVSDHFHPWIDQQGQSPFVWSVLGALAEATERLQVGTGVTCPTMRLHPAIVAQAAATTAAMMPGRFFLGVGTGEQLNEHVTGDAWPTIRERRAMLAEAVDVIRGLWTGDEVTFAGEYYVVEDARLYTTPDTPPPLYVAAGGDLSARLAGERGDGLVVTSPAPDLIEAYRSAGGRGPRIAQATVCWASTEAEGRSTMRRYWPTSGTPGGLNAELRRPADFEAVASVLSEEQIVGPSPCGPDVERHVDSIRRYIEAGYDHVYVHQVGPEQEGFIDFYQREVLPHLAPAPARLAGPTRVME